MTVRAAISSDYGTTGDDVDTYTIMLLVVGALPGFLLGRWSAEYRRARADMRTVWNGRKKYRS